MSAGHAGPELGPATRQAGYPQVRSSTRWKQVPTVNMTASPSHRSAAATASRRLGILAALVGLQAPAPESGPHPPLPISEVVKLSKAGTSPELVIAKLRSTRSVYAPRGSDFGKLADLGVKPPVLDFIQVKFVGDVELLTRYYVLGESLGGCVYCFPQPLDLANLASGGNGMSLNLPTGNYTDGGRPPGVPAWVPYSPGLAFEQPPPSRWTRSPSAPRRASRAEELARQVRSSRLEGLIAQGGLTLGTMSSVGLSGSAAGGAAPVKACRTLVLDALQEQYLAQFVEFQRLRYQNWGKGPSFN